MSKVLSYFKYGGIAVAFVTAIFLTYKYVDYRCEAAQKTILENKIEKTLTIKEKQDEIRNKRPSIAQLINELRNGSF